MERIENLDCSRKYLLVTSTEALGDVVYSNCDTAMKVLSAPMMVTNGAFEIFDGLEKSRILEWIYNVRLFGIPQRPKTPSSIVRFTRQLLASRSVGSSTSNQDQIG